MVDSLIDFDVDNDESTAISKQRSLSSASHDPTTQQQHHHHLAYSDDDMQQLVELFDPEGTGTIAVEKFVTLARQNMAYDDDASSEESERKLKELVMALDPFDIGQIGYSEFISGIKKLTSSSTTYDMATHNDNNNNNNSSMTSTSAAAAATELNNKNQLSISSILSSTSSSATPSSTTSVSPGSDTADGGGGKPSSTVAADNDDDTLNEPNRHNFELLKQRTEDEIIVSDFDAATFDQGHGRNKLLPEPSGDLYLIGGSSSAADSSGAMDEDMMMEELNSLNSTHGGGGGNPFGLDPQTMRQHREALSNSSSMSNSSGFASLMTTPSSAGGPSSGLLTTASLKASVNRRTSALNSYNMYKNNSSVVLANVSGTGDSSLIYESGTAEQIDSLQERIARLQSSVQAAEHERDEYAHNYDKLHQEHENSIRKARELEDHNQELERRLEHEQVKKDNELQRHQEIANKQINQYLEERDNLITQLHQAETQISHHKEENARQLKEINELNKKFDKSEDYYSELNEKYQRLSSDHQRILKEKEFYREQNEQLKMQHNERIDALTAQLNETRIQLQQSSSLMSRQRQNTMSLHENGLVDLSRFRDLEAELKQAHQELKHAQAQNEELNAHILRMGVDNGRTLLRLTTPSAVSFAAEIDTMSKDDIMEKLRNEEQNAQRLREYLDSILSRIMEHNPEILEVNPPGTSRKASTSSGASNGGSRKNTMMSSMMSMMANGRAVGASKF